MRPTQDRIAALAARFGVTTYASYEHGLNTEFAATAGPTGSTANCPTAATR